MSEIVSAPEVIARAYHLAFFIHPDKRAALKIATAAVAKLEVAIAAQDKRLYYRPIGRFLPERLRHRAHRSKVSLSELQLLQRLIYLESEPYERQKEQDKSPNALTEEDMVIHFIKHLVSITIRRNSFYVALGLSRLLHDYSTAEAIGIYDAVVQTPERMRDSDYFRSRKSRLMHEMKQRFGGLIKIHRRTRGEERFEARPPEMKLVEFVRDCLDRFAPWSTPCLVPAAFNAVEDEIPALSSSGYDPDGEHPVEVNRIHALLHSDCYRRLVRAVGLDSPDLRLAVPQFVMSNQHNGDNHNLHNRRNPPDLTEEEATAIKNYLGRQTELRRRAPGQMLRVVVDRVECARLDVRKSDRVRVTISDTASLIEILEGESDHAVLLAVHLPEDETDGGGQSQPRSIILEGGQQLSFSITRPVVADQSGDLFLEVTYRETSPLRAARAKIRREFSPLFANTSGTGFAPLWKPALMIGLVAVIAVGVFLYTRSTGRMESGSIQAEADTPPDDASSVESTAATRPEKSGANESPEGAAETANHRQQKPGQSGRQRAFTAEAKRRTLPPSQLARAEIQPPPDAGATREIIPKAAPATLQTVTNIYVDCRRCDALSKRVRNAIIRELKTSDRFKVTETGSADAALKITAKTRAQSSNAKEIAIVDLQLVNVDGQNLWPVTTSEASKRYEGSLSKVAAAAVADLLRDAQRAEPRR